MIYLNRRFFLKKGLGIVMLMPLNVVICRPFLHDFRDNFVCEDFYLMGTSGKIQIFYDNVEYGRFLISKAINRIRELEYCLTKFSPNSDVGRINVMPFDFHKVSVDTFNVFTIGKKISELTFGYFDMGLGNILSYCGIDNLVPIVGKVTKIPDMLDDLFVFSDKHIKLNRNNSMIDLGGIGKGFALDECIKILINGGIKHIAIEFGGDVRVFGGMPNDVPWKIVLDKKLYNFLHNDVVSFDLYNGSLAVSGGYLKKSNLDMYHHIIDPFSLISKNNYLCLLVHGNESAYCDALSTAFFNMEVDMIEEVIKKFNGYSFKIY